MPTLKFTISPTAVGQIHEFLSCLAKFDENVSLEAFTDKLCFSSLNVSKTAHASFSLDAAVFFSRYQCSDSITIAPRAANKAIWACRVQNRALLSIFKKRGVENRDKDTALERCEVELQARADQTECRLVIRMLCRHGVVKTYRLTYESAEVLHATFDSAQSENHWTISSKTLHDVVEYFGPKTDQLDWYFHDQKVTFTSYTEKVQNGREILKQPMHTSVALERKDFDDFNVQQGLHIGIVVKDFRAIVGHAETMRANVTARYSRGNRPMQIIYDLPGILCEFTLMTRSLSNDVPSGSTRSTPIRDLSVKPVSQLPQSQTAASIPATTQSADSMPPPARTMPHRGSRIPSPQPVTTKADSQLLQPTPSMSIDPDSMFVPGDDDQQWDEPSYDEEPDFVMYDNASDSVSTSVRSRRIQDSETTAFRSTTDPRDIGIEGIAPTQRLSQVRGLFD